MFDVTILGALLAGLLSFLSPCVLPIVPFYLSYLAGVGMNRLSDNDGLEPAVRNRAVLAACMFALGVATIFSLVSMIVKPIVSLISLPLLVLTLGLFYLLINALMLWITSWLTSQAWLGDWGLEIHGGFWWYLWIALILAVLQTVIGWVVPGKRD